MNKTFVCLLSVLFCAEFAIAADNNSGAKKDVKKENPIQAVLTMPVKMVTPIVSGKASETKKEPDIKMKSLKDMTNAELASDIRDTLSNNEGVIVFIPELKKEKDSAGNIVYTYQGITIDSLDRERLDKLSGRVRNEASRIRAERINKQLADLRRIQLQTRSAASGNMKVPGSVRTPQVPKIPQVPKMPARPVVTPKPLPKIPQALKRTSGVR